MQVMQAAVEVDPHGQITIFVDSANAFNSADRALMLKAVYNEPKLSHVWNAMAFCYSNPSTLLLRERGQIVDTISSEQGSRQGCVFGGLGYATLFQPVFEACVAPFPDVTARAIMDDFAITGPPEQVFAAFAQYKVLAQARGVSVNIGKTHVLQASGEPAPSTVALALQHGLPIHKGIHKYVGGYVGSCDVQGEALLRKRLLRETPILRAIRDPDFPLALAMQVAKIHVLPAPTYFLRALPFRVSKEPIAEFDCKLREAILLRCNLSAPLPPTASTFLSQPVGNGGIGLRELGMVAPAAKWASAASVAQDTLPFFEQNPTLPFVLDREDAFDELVAGGVTTAGPDIDCYTQIEVSDEEKKAFGPYADPRLRFLPHEPDLVATFYDGKKQLKSLQRMLSRVLLHHAADTFLDSADCSPADKIRISACRAKESGLWLQLHPKVEPLSDAQFRIALRLRLGLSPMPFDLPPKCPLCLKTTGDPWHPFACSATRRRMVTTSHDNVMSTVVRFARDCGAQARLEPKDLGSLVPDGEFFLSTGAVLVDASGVSSLAPSHLKGRKVPGRALASRARYKHNKYNGHADSLNSRFVPLVLDRFGCFHKEFSAFLKELDTEAKQLGMGTLSPTRLDLPTTLLKLSNGWQADGARIVYQWLTMVRMHQHRAAVHRLGYIM